MRWIAALALLALCAIACGQGNVAILVQGGQEPWFNFSAFTQSNAKLYPALGALGWDITVLDGNGPTNDIAMYGPGFPPAYSADGDACHYYASAYDDEAYSYWGALALSPDDYDRDGIGDVDYAATKANVLGVLASVGRVDRLLLVLTDHGGQGYEFGLWGRTAITGAEIGGALAAVDYGQATLLVDTCYAASLIPFLPADVTVLTSSGPDTYGWASNDIYYKNGPLKGTYYQMQRQWGYALVPAMGRDRNGDGVVWWSEAYQTLLELDEFSPQNQPYEQTYPDGTAYVDTTGELIEYPTIRGEGIAWLVGDLTGDWTVDASDYNVLLASLGSPGSWWAGDLTGDAWIDASDYNVMLDRLGATMQLDRAVPDPAALLGLMAGALILLGRRHEAR